MVFFNKNRLTKLRFMIAKMMAKNPKGFMIIISAMKTTVAIQIHQTIILTRVRNLNSVREEMKHLTISNHQQTTRRAISTSPQTSLFQRIIPETTLSISIMELQILK